MLNPSLPHCDEQKPEPTVDLQRLCDAEEGAGHGLYIAADVGNNPHLQWALGLGGGFLRKNNLACQDHRLKKTQRCKVNNEKETPVGLAN